MTRIIDRQGVDVSALRRRAAEAAASSEARAVAVRAKRDAHKAAPREVPDFDCVGEPKQRAPNAADVERWWHEGIRAAFDGRVPHEAWTVRQLVLAKKLLAAYGADEVRRGLAEALAGWAEHPAVVAGALPIVPTFSLVYGMRATIWVAAAAGLARSDADGLVKHKKGATMSDKEARRAARRATGEWDPKETDPKKIKGVGW